MSGCGWGAGYHPLFQDLTSALWDQAPTQMGTLCGLRSAGTRPRPQRGFPQHELPPASGHWPQEGGWPWGQRPGSGASGRGVNGCSSCATGPQPPPYTLPGSSHPQPRLPKTQGPFSSPNYCSPLPPSQTLPLLHPRRNSVHNVQDNSLLSFHRQFLHPE